MAAFTLHRVSQDAGYAHGSLPSGEIFPASPLEIW